MTEMEEMADALRRCGHALERLERVLKSDSRVITCGEAAYLLGRSGQTVSRYIAEGKLRKACGNGVKGVALQDVIALIGPE